MDALEKSDVKDSVTAMMGDAVKEAIGDVKNDPAFKEMLKTAVMGQVKEVLSGKIAPDGVKVAGTELVGRDGKPVEMPPVATQNPAALMEDTGL